MHALSDPSRLLGLARSLARTGQYSDWPAVHARLTELGFADIEAVVTPQVVAEITEICTQRHAAEGSSD